MPSGTATYREGAAQAAAHLASSTSDVGVQRGLLGNLASEAAALPSEALGPGSHFIQRAGQWFQEFTGGKASPLSAEQTGAMDAFVKNSQQLANALLPAIGNSSDRSQLAAIASNPNQFLSKNGIGRITALLNGSLDAVQAKNLEWQKSGSDPGDFYKWESKFNQNYDPRVFQAPYMSPAQKTELIDSLGGKGSKDYQTFINNFNAMAHKGYIHGITPQGQ